MGSSVIRNPRPWLLSVAILMASASAGAQTAPQASLAPPTSGMIEQSLATATATVEEIDQKTRQVTLRRADGSKLSFRAGDQVKNLAQVAKGDEVVVQYYESLAYRLLAPGESAPEAAVALGAARAEPGQQPEAAEAAAITVTAAVTGIDREKNYVTLRGPEGKEVTTKVRDPRRLEAVKVGDRVELTYTEALGISVEKAAGGK